MACNTRSVPFIAVLVLVLTAGMAAAADPADMGGWQEDSAYNRLYDPIEMDKFKALVEDVREVVPMPGMSPGVAIEIREGKRGGGDRILVHLCPVWFAKPGEIGIKKGDQIKLRGAWAEINGQDVFMASKVKKGDYFEFKVRLTKNGKPFWTMTPEELKKEESASQASLK
jgi:hypothetical protein